MGCIVALGALSFFAGRILCSFGAAAAFARRDLNFSTRPAVSINFSSPV
jgi:hypothetical protein